jgi:hypothetical protein
MKWGAVSRTTALHRGGVHGSVCAHSRSTRSRSFQLSHPNAELDAAHADPHCLLLHHAKCLQVPLLGPCTGHRVQRIHQRLPFPADLIFPRPQLGKVIGHLTTPVSNVPVLFHTRFGMPSPVAENGLAQTFEPHVMPPLPQAREAHARLGQLSRAHLALIANCRSCEHRRVLSVPDRWTACYRRGLPTMVDAGVCPRGDQRLTTLMRCRRFS